MKQDAKKLSPIMNYNNPSRKRCLYCRLLCQNRGGGVQECSVFFLCYWSFFPFSFFPHVSHFNVNKSYVYDLPGHIAGIDDVHGFLLFLLFSSPLAPVHHHHHHHYYYRSSIIFSIYYHFFIIIITILYI